MNTTYYHDKQCDDCKRIGSVVVEDGWVVCKCGNDICEVEE